MTPEQRAELRRLCEEATEGPWEWVIEDESMLSLGTEGIVMENTVLWCNRCDSCIKYVREQPERFDAWRCGMPNKINSDFIAASRTALPALLDEVERLEAEIERLKKEKA